MQWIGLHIANTRAAVDEIDEVLRALHTLEAQRAKLDEEIDVMEQTKSANGGPSKKFEIELMRKRKQASKMDSAISTIVEAMKNRAQELKAFYEAHDLDQRAAVLEPSRLAIKRALLERGQTLPTGTTSSFRLPGGAATGRSSLGGSVASAPPAAASSSTHTNYNSHNNPTAPAGRTPDSILLKVILSEAEFNEVQKRRKAMQALMGG